MAAMLALAGHPRLTATRAAFCSSAALRPRAVAHGRVLQRLKRSGICASARDGAAGPLDAIIVLGGGLRGDGGVPPWGQRRLELAEQLWRSCEFTNGKSPPQILLLGAGTPHKPAVIKQGGQVLTEGAAYADYLLAKGIAPSFLLKECSSYDTVGNGYFSLTIHAIPAQWKNLAVITSTFHMPRARAIFDVTYGLAKASALGGPFQLAYYEARDDGLFDPGVAQARHEKETAAAQAWLRDTRGLASLADLHNWLCSTHLCYAVARQNEPPLHDDPKLGATY